MCTKQYRVPSTECREDSLRLSTLSTQHPALSTQCGASLIELIMFVMIVSIALAGILLVMNQTTGHSADALIRKQALVVAESKLEEIELQDFSNILAWSGASGVSGQDSYIVSVAGSALGGIPAASAAQITVTVTDPAGQITTATGYRVNY